MQAKINGITMRFDLAGKAQAPVVILVHGFPFDLSLWKAQVAALKKDFRVLSYDLRGMGKSGLGPAPQPLEAYVDDLFALMDHLGLKQAGAAGLSMGGYIVLRAMQREPSRFWALALCDTRADADSDEGRLKRAAGIKAVREKGVAAFVKGMLPNLLCKQKSPAATALLKMMLSSNADGVANALAAMAARTDSTASLKDIKIPALVVTGDQDALMPPLIAKGLALKIKASEFVEIPDAGHVSNLENPVAFNKAFLAFLRKAASRT